MARGRWDHDGKSSHQRGYGAEWQKLRRQILDDDPLCRVCRQQGRTRLATAVDHIKSKAKGGTDALDNLRPICDACHRAKTAEDAGRPLRPTIGSDGWPR